MLLLSVFSRDKPYNALYSVYGYAREVREMCVVRQL